MFGDGNGERIYILLLLESGLDHGTPALPSSAFDRYRMSELGMVTGIRPTLRALLPLTTLRTLALSACVLKRAHHYLPHHFRLRARHRAHLPAPHRTALQCLPLCLSPGMYVTAAIPHPVARLPLVLPLSFGSFLAAWRYAPSALTCVSTRT